LNKKTIFLIAGLVLLALAFSGCTTEQPNTGGGGEAAEKATVSFSAVVGDIHVLDSSLEVEKGTNAFEAFQQAADIGFTDYGEMGVLVESINGIAPGENEFWKLFVNGEESMVGINSISIEEDTLIEWKIDSFENYAG